jgi:hypothetical protein
MVNEVQAILRQVEANTQVTPAGFADLSQGLAVIAELAGRQLELLQEQVEIERSIARSVERSLRIAEVAHASAALELDRDR